MDYSYTFFLLCSLLQTALAANLQGSSKALSATAATASSSGLSYIISDYRIPQLTPTQFLFISSPSQQKIVYTELRNFQSATGRTYVLVDSGLSYPAGLAFDNVRGHLYVADKGASYIYRYAIQVAKDAKGHYSLTTDNTRICIAPAETEWLSVDFEGNLYWSGIGMHSINKLTIATINELLKGELSCEDLKFMSESQLEALWAKTAAIQMSQSIGEPAEAATAETPLTAILGMYEASSNNYVASPQGVAAVGKRLYWANGANGNVNGTVVMGEVEPPYRAQTLQGVTPSFPSLILTNQTAVARSLAASNTMVFYTTVDTTTGSGTVIGVSTGGVAVNYVTSLGTPNGMVWDGDQTMYVADTAANMVYSFPVGRLSPSAPLMSSVQFKGPFGLALLSEEDPAFAIATSSS